MHKINKVHARQIIDSRGNPTIEVEVSLDNQLSAYASSPSGASVGSLEGMEIRDNDQSQYHGRSVYRAISNVNNQINDLLVGLDPSNQTLIDQKMIELDGTKNKSVLGANAILATSLAVCRVAALLNKLPLYKYIRKVNNDNSKQYILPTPMMNIINGGVHADNKLDLQEFMIVPTGNFKFTEKIRTGVEIFHHLKDILKSKSYSISVGDEGGFAPNLHSSRQALDYILEATNKSGYVPGKDISIAIDSAASIFYHQNIYSLNGENMRMNSEELTNYYLDLINNYPIYSLEDAMAEDDIEGWKLLTDKIGDKIQLVSDDLTVTNAEILKKIISANIANTILIKPNQIGSLSETLTTINLAHESGYKTIISHRSGETEDSFISHLAVAVNSHQIKAGSLSRTDRLVKYNELLRIEEDLCDY